ncbi:MULTISPECIES: hypothetical protein [unclassified Corynebacterium]|uniref:hypothetical protein n=1 Tax=unclassified Corynebacterium TaxID=2624378 RepID=UPI0021AA67CA|nr:MULTISPECIES: hypothetical protein [unclassified Corynebacterium]MCT1452127.1 hypothetical protein [Corynebacterium sp. p3-SID1145]MCT1461829.1 hypothetical protein [Corynebacterium sp. p3-SID1140]MDN8595236.1 hypothetical protein [Corynebacterium sp. P4_F2]WKK55363.1 hypothetical protein QYR03_09225 [Corynebacterium sp. P4-C1]WKK62771.1 hypothetical protein QYR04_07920 [Corynebacterium sp. P8-C1]
MKDNYLRSGGELSESLMSARDEDVDWYDHQRTVEQLEEQVTNTKKKRTWYSLLTGAAADETEDNHWFERSRPNRDQADRVNEMSNLPNKRSGWSRHALNFGTTVLSVSLFATLALTPVAQGGWSLQPTGTMMAAYAVAFVGLTVALHTIFTRRSLERGYRPWLGAGIVSLILLLGVTSLALYLASTLGVATNVT